MTAIKKNAAETVKRSAVANAAASRTLKPGEYLGDLVAWHFADNDGFSHPRETVNEIFERHGFRDIVSTEVDFGYAITQAPHRCGRIGGSFIVKAMTKHRKDTPAALCVYKKSDSDTVAETGDKWEPGARVRVMANSVEALPLEDEVMADADCLVIAQRVARKANEIAYNVTNKEISGALCAAGLDVMWATFRKKKGGVWFVYAEKAKRFRALLDDLEALGGFYPTIQPLYVDDEGRSVRNVADASKGVLETELARLKDDLQKAMDDGMRNSSLERRVRACDELLARAELYSELLADKAESIRHKAENLKASFGQMLDGEDAVFADVLSKVDDVAVAKLNGLAELTGDADEIFDAI